jgi:hypothetical protein
MSIDGLLGLPDEMSEGLDRRGISMLVSRLYSTA